MRYKVLDDIAYTGADGKPKTAAPGAVVELNEKDAATLLTRGAVKALEPTASPR